MVVTTPWRTLVLTSAHEAQPVRRRHRRRRSRDSPRRPAAGACAAADPAVCRRPADRAAGNTKYSFIAYGDTRSSGALGEPGDGDIVHPEHSRLVDLMIERVRRAASTPFPVRFVLQSGDAVLRGAT